MTMLSAEAQIRYIIQWFREWGEVQRLDFLPTMAEKYATGAYVNGIVEDMANLNCRNRPMSIFECRVKLFEDWFMQWSIEQKESVLKQISDIDPNFAAKLNAELQNGDGADDDAGSSSDESTLRE